MLYESKDIFLVHEEFSLGIPIQIKKDFEYLSNNSFIQDMDESVIGIAMENLRDGSQSISRSDMEILWKKVVNNKFFNNHAHEVKNFLNLDYYESLVETDGKSVADKLCPKKKKSDINKNLIQEAKEGFNKTLNDRSFFKYLKFAIEQQDIPIRHVKTSLYGYHSDSAEFLIVLTPDYYKKTGQANTQKNNDKILNSAEEKIKNIGNENVYQYKIGNFVSNRFIGKDYSECLSSAKVVCEEIASRKTGSIKVTCDLGSFFCDDFNESMGLSHALRDYNSFVEKTGLCLPRCSQS